MKTLAKNRIKFLKLFKKNKPGKEHAVRKDQQDLEDIVCVIAREFDEAYYLEQYPDVKKTGVSAIEHFITHGAYENRKPNCYFDTDYYVTNNSEIVNDGINPFYHYLVSGRKQGRLPSKIGFSYKDKLPENFQHIVEVIQPEFDVKFYLNENPDVAAAGVDPVVHYIVYGWCEGRDPNDEFDTKYYMESNEDVVRAGVMPFYHYIVAGRSEGRSPKQNCEQSCVTSFNENEFKHIVDVISPHFNSTFYLKMYPHVAQSGMTPVEHYVREGWKAGYWPTPTFNSNFYLKDNVDVLEAGVNPFYHYIVAGRFERRHIDQPGGDKANIIYQIKTAEEIKREWAVNWSGDILSGQALRNLLQEELAEENIISFSHDVYLDNVGGVQLCVAIEQKVFEKNCQGYLHLAPVQPLPYLGENSPDVLLHISLNGVYRGVATVKTLVEQLKLLSRDFFPVIHALHGHSPENITKILKAIGCKELIFWLHDFFILCEGYNLLRNNVDYCGVPSVYSQACSICIHGERRQEHIKRLERMFSNFEVHIISPSEHAARLYSEKEWFKAESIRIVEHLKYIRSWKRDDYKACQPIRVGFIGYPAYHKGWGDFVNLVKLFLTDERYEFVHLSRDKTEELPIEHVEAKASFNDPGATIKAVSTSNIDVVLILSKCPETFNFTCYEAVAAGAKVITYAGAGNVAEFIKKEGHGKVVNGFNDLYKIFENGLPLDLLNGRYYFEVEYSKMSLEMLKDR